jgi:catechol 2,3-dioxygenase-like lactoylglutathione lyase family enzyme
MPVMPDTPAAPVLQFAHLSRSTNNLAALVEFYLGLGCTLEKRLARPDEGLERAVLVLPGSSSKLQLIERQGVMAAPIANDWPDHLKFFCADLDAALATLVGLGASVRRPPYRLSPNGNRIAFVSDPDGQYIELVERAV